MGRNSKGRVCDTVARVSFHGCETLMRWRRRCNSLYGRSVVGHSQGLHWILVGIAQPSSSLNYYSCFIPFPKSSLCSVFQTTSPQNRDVRNGTSMRCTTQFHKHHVIELSSCFRPSLLHMLTQLTDKTSINFISGAPYENAINNAA